MGQRTGNDPGHSCRQAAINDRRPEHIPTWDVLSVPSNRPRTGGCPAFALVSAYVEPPAGIEPATPSLPWNHQEPLCEPPFPQVAPDRRGRSYRFSFGQVMRSLQSRLIAAGAGHHPTQRSPTQPAFLFDHLPLALGRRPQQSSEYKGSSATRSPPGRPPPRSVRSMAMGMSSAGAAPRTRSARPRGR
jgi:hypothetical protein